MRSQADQRVHGPRGDDQGLHRAARRAAGCAPGCARATSRAWSRPRRASAPSSAKSATPLPGAPEEFIEGEGEVIEYDGRTDNVRFIAPRRAAPLPGRCPERRAAQAPSSSTTTSPTCSRVDGQRRLRLRRRAAPVVAACARCWRPRSRPRRRRRLAPGLWRCAAPQHHSGRRRASERPCRASGRWRSSSQPPGSRCTWPSPTAAARWSRTCRWSCKRARWWACWAPTARARPPRST